MPLPRCANAITAAAILLTAVAPAAAEAQADHPTPRISLLETITMQGVTAYVMRANLGNTEIIIGLAATCDPRLEVTVYFGGYPADRRPVQLAVRGADGRVHRFGPVERGGPGSGFHSPRARGPDAARFVDAALRSGALVSNGFRSFFNDAPPSRNLEARTALLGCPR
jgi:hypothetical protein